MPTKLSARCKDLVAQLTDVSRQVTDLERQDRPRLLRIQVEVLLDFCLFRGELCTYSAIAKMVGSFSGGSEMAGVLAEIARSDVSQKKPMRTAVVVGMSPERPEPLPGTGFFDLACELGFNIDDSPTAERAFWVAELAKLGFKPPEQIQVGAFTRWIMPKLEA